MAILTEVWHYYKKICASYALQAYQKQFFISLLLFQNEKSKSLDVSIHLLKMSTSTDKKKQKKKIWL